jgi:diguanylate cyclase (GGDEF)-like protein/PAS domain S-box-containing protein
MNKPIKVLIVEDSEDDAILALRALHRGGFDPTHQRVQTAADLQGALAQERWDAVISDFSMPGFTGLDALGIFRSAGLDIPFILISGTIGEATAVAAMKAGASDYMMKSSLARLAPALERELKETQMRAANQRAQAALIDSEERFRQMAENIRDVFFLVDVDGERVLYVSPAYEEIWGRSSESLYANPQSWTEAVHPDDRASAYEKYGQIVSASKAEFEFRMVRPDGSIRWIKVRGFPVRDDADKIVRIAGIAADVTDQKTDAEKFKTAQDRITHLNRVYAMLSGINTLIVRVHDRDELFKEACRIAVEEGGFRMAMIATVHHSTTKIVPVATAGKDEELMSAINNILSSSEHAPKTMSARAIRDKKAVVSNAAQNDPQVLFSAQYIKAGVQSMAVFPLIVSNEAVGVLALYANETEFFKDEELKLLSELAGDVAFAIDHIGKQERLNYLAYYDVLTGLANRSLFLERVAQSIRSAVRGGDKLALFLIDLERFKNINDSLGRPAGDMLLRLVAEWLTSKLGDANLLARVGADLFAMVLPQVKQDGEVARALEQLMAAFLEHPFQLDDAVLRISAKVGIALFPYDGADSDTLFKNAESALNKAKTSGDRYLFYTQKMTDMVAGKLTLENQLRQALDKGEFVLHYQPKVNLASGKMTSAEALIRWNDPRTGLVPPARFIPILEETGLIQEVGRWALRQAIKDALRWRSAGLAALRIAVNVSPLQLRHRGFIDEVRQAISIDAHAAAGLELEITESLLMENVQHSITSLQAIRDMGVTLAIDDFGTGFSSLSYLSKFPVDTLKIDRSFVIEMTDAPESLALVSTIISLAHALKLKVVAEGVETEEQSRLLRVLNCDEIQGFVFSKPVPSDIFEAKYLALPSSP